MKTGRHHRDGEFSAAAEPAPAAAKKSPAGRGRAGPALLWGLIAACTAVELALSLSDLGIGPARLRTWAYEWGGFWPGLLGDWRPNYAVQPAAMFLTYGFLHGGPVHLAVNMVTLFSLGRAVMEWAGAKGFWIVYAAGQVGGGLGYALLADTPRPMVGASGALFGLAGAYLAWHLADRLAFRETLWPVAKAVLFLAAINVAMAVALEGQLAWEAHLGGFLAGGAVVMFRPGRRPTGARPGRAPASGSADGTAECEAAQPGEQEQGRGR